MDFPARESVEGLIDPLPLPEFTRITYEPETTALDDVGAIARQEVEVLPFDDLDQGDTVAIGVGSRGIDNLVEITSTAVATVRDLGYEPVVVPAMGSHGGATETGQRDVLEHLGIDETTVDAPIDARMDATRVGEVTVGETAMPVFFSTAALEADGVVVINRVKAHTNYTGRFESGLTKMTVVGLGKQRGAKTFHSTAIAEGYEETLEAALDVILDAAPVLGGVALVENFHEETALVEAIPAGSFTDREPALLERAYEEMATLPVDDIDLLVVDEIGKDISGAGMDTNVIGRYRVLNAPDPETPAIKLIYVRGLSEKTSGNGNGIGLADLTRQAAIDQLDLEKAYANAITSGSLEKSKLPVVAPDDEIALRIALASLGGYDPETVRVVWIENTQDLGELVVSDAVLSDLPPAASPVETVSVTFEDGTAQRSID
ncbi:Uncharacterized protein HSRCO_2769 [Halanaeroarchaeum sp. HSR-CO]|uniref:DUF362 domain-containing protein n=1 Tax=Halanaeroarchaeum sp. HSR-CO TaxID=2866382 RepID=UPI00217D884F|nr:DUF362 domain-containing protein [Halanaeroarchaeum sp. HSR-CO]UWG49025.1 Uncharacterized protein HSRCO_2769 [Halanaeroarchaeum sp. HSR-CO]